MLGEIRMNGGAEWYLTKGGFDEIKGLPEVAKD